MSELNENENKLIQRFNNLEGNSEPFKITNLHRDILKYYKSNGEMPHRFFDILGMLEIHSAESDFSIFDYVSKFQRTYQIAEPTVRRLLYLKEERFNSLDLTLSQMALPFTKTVEEAKELCLKAFIVLNKFEVDKPDYKKNKFICHINMMDRALKAHFFEVEGSEAEIVKVIFEKHLKEALAICKETDDIDLISETLIKVRAAAMERDSEKVVEHLEVMKKIKAPRRFYDSAREEISEYSSDLGFTLTEKQFSIAVGDRIRKLRERLGIELIDLGEKLGYTSESTISSIERGEINLPGYKLFVIADLFGVTVGELCYGVSDRRKPSLKKEDFKIHV